MLATGGPESPGGTMSWYDLQDGKHPKSKLTRLSDLTPAMLGKESKKKLLAEAAETWGLHLFAVEMLATHGQRLGSDAGVLFEGGQPLREITAVFKRYGNVMSSADREDSELVHALSAYVRHGMFLACTDAGTLGIFLVQSKLSATSWFKA